MLTKIKISIEKSQKFFALAKVTFLYVFLFSLTWHTSIIKAEKIYIYI